MKGCLTQVKTFNATIHIVHIDVSGVIPFLVLVIRCRDLYFCMRSRRGCCIPEEVFLMCLRPGCNTDVLDPTSLRCLVHRYRKGSRTRINILDPCLGLGRHISKFNFCSCRTSPYTRAIILDVVKMNMVFTSGVLVITRFDRYLVVSVRLTSRFIPADIVLAVLIRPSWNLNGPHTFRAIYILNNDVKGTCILVVVLDYNCTRTSGLTDFCCSFCNIVSLVSLIHVINMDMVFAFYIFMI